MNYWQVAAGDDKGDYSKIFLNFGVMLVGPGEPGDYVKNEHKYKDIKRWVTRIGPFAKKVKEGDIVVLKKPSGSKWKAFAVGTVASEYKFSEVFDDAEGWHLQHYRKVKWFKPKRNIEIRGLARGTFKGIRKLSEKEKEKLIELTKNKDRYIKPKKIPETDKIIKSEELIGNLIQNGLSIKNAEELIQTFNRIRKLVQWYYNFDRDVKEHEVRTFLVIPLLLALGWPEQMRHCQV